MPSPRLTFRLRGPISGSPSYQFSVERRYAPGHQLTAGEAQALDQLRAENIQHNLRSVFASELAAVMPGELLSPDAIERVQGAIDSYAERYAFLEKHQSRGRPGAIGLALWGGLSSAWDGHRTVTPIHFFPIYFPFLTTNQ